MSSSRESSASSVTEKCVSANANYLGELEETELPLEIYFEEAMSQPTVTDWISAVVACLSFVVSAVGLIGLWLAYRQLRLTREQAIVGVTQTKIAADQLQSAAAQFKLAIQQYLDDHERSRRHLAVELLQQWATTGDSRTSAAWHLAQELKDPVETKKLAVGDGFEMPAQHKELILGCLDVDFHKLIKADESTGKIRIPQLASIQIRHEIIKNLNAVEFVLAAFKHEVADRDMIEEQFRFVIARPDGKHIFHEFKDAHGGDTAYPAIAYFEKYLKEKITIPAKNKMG